MPSLVCPLARERQSIEVIEISTRGQRGLVVAAIHSDDLAAEKVAVVDARDIKVAAAVEFQT